jgi:uncharacterized protein involved in response to NO
VLALANAGFHAEAHFSGTADYSLRAGIAAILMLIMLIGGRIIPSFTHNWLVRENPGRLPVPFDRFDMVCIAASAAMLCVWVVLPDAFVTGVLLCAAAILHCARLARWAGERTTRESLVLILHVAYAFVPLASLWWGWPHSGSCCPARRARLDGRSRGDHDTRCHEARKPRPYRA